MNVAFPFWDFYITGVVLLLTTEKIEILFSGWKRGSSGYSLDINRNCFFVLLLPPFLQP